MSTVSKIQVDTKTFIRFWLVIIGFIIAGFIFLKAASGLLVVGAALFLAIAISPLVKKMADIIPGKGRTLPIAVSYVIVVGFLVAFIAIVVPTIVNESVRFVGNLPSVVDSTTGNIKGINELGAAIGISNLQDQVHQAVETFSTDFIKNFGTNITTSLGALGNAASALILILVLAFFMLTEGPDLLHRFWRNFHNNPRADRIHRVFDRMAHVITKYVSNAITVSLINACATATAVFILSLIFGFSAGLALPFGLITGVFSLIPMFGSFIGGCLVALLLAFNAWGAGLAFFIYTIIYLQIESNVISPKIQSKGLKLPALVVLASVTIGVYTFGLIGAIIAIPIAGCIKVLIEEFDDDITPNTTDKTPDVELATSKVADKD